MTVPQRSTRRLQDIRTHAAMSGESRLPHQRYLRVACLEIEKFRRAQERDSAVQRVESIDARLREIETEQAALVPGLAPGTGTPEVGAPATSRSGPGGAKGGPFKFRY